jgi:hypothetical protein
MKLSLSLAQRGNLYPSVYNCLRSLPDCALHHSDHGLRHPLGIYSLSLGRVVQAFKVVLDENDKIYQTPIDNKSSCNFETTALLKAQQELLDALMAHIDDCYQILKALYPANRNGARKPAHFAHQWLYQAKHPTAEFFRDQINPYRETFAPIDNKVKHEHGRLRSIVMRHPALLDVPHLRVAGYFVEGVDSHQTLGPDREIHEGKYAISFNHDLRHHFVHLFTIGHFLTQALVDLIEIEYLPHFKPEQYVSVSQSEIEEIKKIAERIASLPFLFYMNEVTKPVPSVNLLATNEDITLLIHEKVVFKTLASLRSSTLNPFQIEIQYGGDSVSRSWKLPYMGLQMNISVNRQGEILEIRVTEKNE